MIREEEGQRRMLRDFFLWSIDRKDYYVPFFFFFDFWFSLDLVLLCNFPVSMKTLVDLLFCYHGLMKCGIG